MRRDGIDWRLDHQFIVGVMHHFPAARFGANDGGREEVARDALHNVLGQNPVPRPHRLPLPIGVVHEFDVADVHELLVTDEVRARIVDDAAIGQRDRQRVAVKIGDDTRLGRNQARLTGID